MSRPLTILRVITRLNIGGPARQAVALSAQLSNSRFRTVLVTGPVGADEGDFGPMAEQAGIVRVMVPALRRPLHPWRDGVAFAALLRLLWRTRPAILHTHLAKAGALGRLAGMLYNAVGPGRRPGHRAALVHTFHGHVLEGYFSPAVSRVFLAIERWLARRTDCLLAVSPTIRDELLAKGIGRPSQWRVIPLGLDLAPLAGIAPPEEQAPVRIGMVGRLVPIKNPGLFLGALHRLSSEDGAAAPVGLVVGDGPLRAPLERQAQEVGLSQRVRFLGWQQDLPSIYEALDVVCLTSWNEGTPVALIEAMAAARPVVATDAGGVRDLLDDGPPAAGPVPAGTFRLVSRGLLVRPGDAQGLAAALRAVAADAGLRRRLGTAARAHVIRQFTHERLVRDLAALYEELAQPGRGAGCTR
jgi:glycosyltransferase involved in cell wall biosynthesis